MSRPANPAGRFFIEEYRIFTDIVLGFPLKLLKTAGLIFVSRNIIHIFNSKFKTGKSSQLLGVIFLL
jgi:hypothetical protein